MLLPAYTSQLPQSSFMRHIPFRQCGIEKVAENAPKETTVFKHGSKSTALPHNIGSSLNSLCSTELLSKGVGICC